MIKRKEGGSAVAEHLVLSVVCLSKKTLEQKFTKPRVAIYNFTAATTAPHSAASSYDEMQLDIPLSGQPAEVARVVVPESGKPSEVTLPENGSLKLQIPETKRDDQSHLQSHSAPIVVPHPTQAEHRSINSVAKPFKVSKVIGSSELSIHKVTQMN